MRRRNAPAILGTLNKAGKALRMMPKRSEHRDTFSVRKMDRGQSGRLDFF